MEPFVLIMVGVGGLIILLGVLALRRRRKRDRLRSQSVTTNNHTRSRVTSTVEETIDDLHFSASSFSSSSKAGSGATHSRPSGDDHGRGSERDGGWFGNLFDGGSNGSGGGSGILDD